MNHQELTQKVHSSMYHQIQKNGYATPVQVLMDIEMLSKADYERWRFGKVDYLERVCKGSLSKLSAVMKEIRSYGTKNRLKAKRVQLVPAGLLLVFGGFPEL